VESGCKIGVEGGFDREVQDASGGEINAEIARAIVGIYRMACGRGPTKARAMFRGDVVVVILEEVLTVVERNLVADGQSEAALAMRRSLHAAMRPALITAVAEATGLPVRALLSDTHGDPDAAVEVFLLDRAVNQSRGAAAPL
jgi:uncharacterized protein YbcI